MCTRGPARRTRRSSHCAGRGDSARRCAAARRTEPCTGARRGGRARHARQTRPPAAPACPGVAGPPGTSPGWSCGCRRWSIRRQSTRPTLLASSPCQADSRLQSAQRGACRARSASPCELRARVDRWRRTRVDVSPVQHHEGWLFCSGFGAPSWRSSISRWPRRCKQRLKLANVLLLPPDGPRTAARGAQGTPGTYTPTPAERLLKR